MPDPRSTDVDSLVHQLAELPGGDSVRVTSRRFARWGPAERAPYREASATWPVAALPPSLEISPDSDEIMITLQGHMPESTPAEQLAARIQLLIQSGDDESPLWDGRMQFPSPGTFSVTVFTAPPARGCAA